MVTSAAPADGRTGSWWSVATTLLSAAGPSRLRSALANLAHDLLNQGTETWSALLRPPAVVDGAQLEDGQARIDALAIRLTSEVDAVRATTMALERRLAQLERRTVSTPVDDDPGGKCSPPPQAFASALARAGEVAAKRGLLPPGTQEATSSVGPAPSRTSPRRRR